MHLAVLFGLLFSHKAHMVICTEDLVFHLDLFINLSDAFPEEVFMSKEV